MSTEQDSTKQLNIKQPPAYFLPCYRIPRSAFGLQAESAGGCWRCGAKIFIRDTSGRIVCGKCGAVQK